MCARLFHPLGRDLLAWLAVLLFAAFALNGSAANDSGYGRGGQFTAFKGSSFSGIIRFQRHLARECAMTDGETRFYLREIQSHWSTSNLSTEKLGELKEAGLVETTANSGITAVRLTPQGARVKVEGRPQGPVVNTRQQSVRKRSQGKGPARRRRAQSNVSPRPLV